LKPPQMSGLLEAEATKGRFMADEEHVALLKQGVDVWNMWRDENPSIRPDLSEANLFRANLGRGNFSMANLGWANFSRANLSGANLSGANLNVANLAWANLRGANLCGASLEGAVLLRTDFTDVNLTGCHIYGRICVESKTEGGHAAELGHHA
jgi:uncharacterized protein YjbI with pentapeptide repeats